MPAPSPLRHFRPLRRFAATLLAALAASGIAQAAELTPLEARWLQGIRPVVAFAKESRWPLDIVVQPQLAPENAPLAMAFVDGRCKLVLSMRGNPEAQGTLERIEPELLDATFELMAAHELGHCRRHLDRDWHGLPDGVPAEVPQGLAAELHDDFAAMKAARREEGYADLVGLAWVQQRHPQHYAKLHAWLMQERSRDLLPGSHHDTLAWLRLAERGVAPAEASIFRGVVGLWTAGLTRAD